MDTRYEVFSSQTKDSIDLQNGEHRSRKELVSTVERRFHARHESTSSRRHLADSRIIPSFDAFALIATIFSAINLNVHSIATPVKDW